MGGDFSSTEKLRNGPDVRFNTLANLAFDLQNELYKTFMNGIPVLNYLEMNPASLHIY